MGKQHLAEIRVDFLVILKDSQADIPQAQSLHPGTEISLFFQRHQRALQRRHSVADFRCHTMAFTGGTGCRIGNTAGCQNDGICRIGSLLAHNLTDCTFGNSKRHSAVSDQRNLQGFQLPLQRTADIKRTVADRENTVSPLRLQRNTDLFKERHGITAIKLGKRAVQELAVLRRVGHQGFNICIVGNIAAALSGDIQFFAQSFIGLQQGDFRTLLGSKNGSHHTGRTAAHNNNFLIHHPFYQTRCIRSKYLPVPQRSRTRLPPPDLPMPATMH